MGEGQETGGGSHIGGYMGGIGQQLRVKAATQFGGGEHNNSASHSALITKRIDESLVKGEKAIEPIYFRRPEVKRIRAVLTTDCGR